MAPSYEASTPPSGPRLQAAGLLPAHSQTVTFSNQNSTAYLQDDVGHIAAASQAGVGFMGGADGTPASPVRMEALMLALLRVMRHLGEPNFLGAARVVSAALGLMVEHRHFFANALPVLQTENCWRCVKCKAFNMLSDEDGSDDVSRKCGLCVYIGDGSSKGQGQGEAFLAQMLYGSLDPGGPLAAASSTFSNASHSSSPARAMGSGDDYSKVLVIASL